MVTSDSHYESKLGVFLIPSLTKMASWGEDQASEAEGERAAFCFVFEKDPVTVSPSPSPFCPGREGRRGTGGDF